MNKRHTLILWDIDGTLVIYKDKYPHRLFQAMVKEFFGKEISLVSYRFSGKTDKAIIADMMGIANITSEEHQEREEEMMEWIADKVEEQTSPESFNLLPNVTALVQKLSIAKDTTQALLTGNLPRCAEIKLRHFDLMKYFAFGAYGVESVNRNDLGPIALKKFAEHHAGNLPKEFDTVVIGDTIPDILCAKHIGAKSIITLTGRTVREEVAPYDPDYIFNDLSDTDKVIEAIYS
ncbi:MAG: HAD hydrolase-like protein [Ignavibacteriota bacterium]